VTGMVLVTLLHAATVSKVLPISIKIKEYALCFAVIFICGYVSRIIKHAVHFSGSEAVNLTGWIAMTVILYIVLLLIFRLIKREELIRIPVIGRFVMR
ncbi:stage V sporulation protein B, partial [Bacillus amyloliquefaciens]|nr:stage V sporulation protein B [Bacillus amyloliquefaciens]